MAIDPHNGWYIFYLDGHFINAIHAYYIILPDPSGQPLNSWYAESFCAQIKTLCTFYQFAILNKLKSFLIKEHLSHIGNSLVMQAAGPLSALVLNKVSQNIPAPEGLICTYLVLTTCSRYNVCTNAIPFQPLSDQKLQQQTGSLKLLSSKEFKDKWNMTKGVKSLSIYRWFSARLQ